jgi:hypothetical protein
MQDPNLRQVSLRFFNAVPYRIELIPHCDLASTIQEASTPSMRNTAQAAKASSLISIGSLLKIAGTKPVEWATILTGHVEQQLSLCAIRLTEVGNG